MEICRCHADLELRIAAYLPIQSDGGLRGAEVALMQCHLLRGPRVIGMDFAVYRRRRTASHRSAKSGVSMSNQILEALHTAGVGLRIHAPAEAGLLQRPIPGKRLVQRHVPERGTQTASL